MHNYFTFQSSANKTTIIPFNYITIMEHSGGSNNISVYTIGGNNFRMTCKDFNESVKLLTAYTTWIDRNEQTSGSQQLTKSYNEMKTEPLETMKRQIEDMNSQREKSADTIAVKEKQVFTHQTCATCHQDCSFIGADMVACAKHIY